MALPPDGLLADPARLAVWLKLPADDPGLLEALRAASDRFAGDVRHPVRLTTGTAETLYGNRTDRLQLSAAPVVAVTSVALDGSLLVEGADYRVRRDIGVLRRWGSGRVWEDWAEVDILYDHGYDPVPDDVQEVVIDQARVIHRVVPGVQTVQAGGEAITYGVTAAVGVTSQWTAAVEKYQLNRSDRT